MHSAPTGILNYASGAWIVVSNQRELDEETQ
jgi:hypothetical protein